MESALREIRDSLGKIEQHLAAIAAAIGKPQGTIHLGDYVRGDVDLDAITDHIVGRLARAFERASASQ